MLKVQEYLLSGKTLNNLETEYGIKSRINEELGVVCLNYSMLNSPMGIPIVEECRQLILELSTWKLAAKSFSKFYNSQEGHAAPINWNTAKIQEKRDGSCILLWYYKDQWNIATKSVPDGNTPVGDMDITFADLVKKTVIDMGFNDFDEFTSNLFISHSYVFELTAPENRVIVSYWERNLTLLATFWNRDVEAYYPGESLAYRAGDEIPISQAHHFSPGLLDKRYKKIETYPIIVSSASELSELAGKLNPFEHEGYVVVDSNFNRVKVKNPLYITASNLVPNLITDKQRVELCLTDNFDDIISLVPDDIRKGLEDFKKDLGNFSCEIEKVYSKFMSIESQKEFALAISGLSYRSILFNRRKGKDLITCLKEMHIDSLVNIYQEYKKQKEKLND